MHWYVYVEHQAYGPYSDAQMHGFVQEGRVSTASLISNVPENGYYGAGEFEAFAYWSAPAQNLFQSLTQQMQATGTTGLQAHQGSPRHNGVQRHQADQGYRDSHTQAVAASTDVDIMRPVSDIEPTVVPQAIAGRARVYLIMAEIRSEGEMAFLKGLQSFAQNAAHTQRLSDTTWLLRCDVSGEQVRNTLSQALNRQDRLFIIDGSSAKPAWFNIGTDLDHRIRLLWDEDET